MSLLLPGERRFRWLEVFVAIVVVLGLCALGCAAPRAQFRGVAPSLFQAARYEARRPALTAAAGQDEGAAFVERALHDAGFRFGTDGTPRALWGYLRTSHRLVGAAEARAGDIVFFDTRGGGPAPVCADRTGIVESVAADGRISFVEARGGRVRRGYVDPAHPRERRGPGGEIVNSFLRPIRIDDPPETRYFAGEMLCGVARAF
ncbi:MAG TPA: CHAP domain-containing protein [Polyangia bacterium]